MCRWTRKYSGKTIFEIRREGGVPLIDLHFWLVWSLPLKCRDINEKRREEIFEVQERCTKFGPKEKWPKNFTKNGPKLTSVSRFPTRPIQKNKLFEICMSSCSDRKTIKNHEFWYAYHQYRTALNAPSSSSNFWGEQIFLADIFSQFNWFYCIHIFFMEFKNRIAIHLVKKCFPPLKNLQIHHLQFNFKII